MDRKSDKDVKEQYTHMDVQLHAELLSGRLNNKSLFPGLILTCQPKHHQPCYEVKYGICMFSVMHEMKIQGN